MRTWVAVLLIVLCVHTPLAQARAHDKQPATQSWRHSGLVYRSMPINGSNAHIIAPLSWWGLNTKQKRAYGHECGPDNTPLTFSRVLRADLSVACSIHDYMYSVGGSEQDRRLADDVLLLNLQASTQYAACPTIPGIPTALFLTAYFLGGYFFNYEKHAAQTAQTR